jgi:hypothetical protein
MGSATLLYTPVMRFASSDLKPSLVSWSKEIKELFVVVLNLSPFHFFHLGARHTLERHAVGALDLVQTDPWSFPIRFTFS